MTATNTITILDLQVFTFTFFYPRRPSRPLPRRSKLAIRFRLFKRAATIKFQFLPAELWDSIHDKLPNHDIKTLALVNSNVGTFARDRLMRGLRSVKMTDATFRSFVATHSMLGKFPLKLQRITISLSPSSQGESINSTGVLALWCRVSRELNHLRELTFLGTGVRYHGACDVLGSLPSIVRLRLFFCEDDNLLYDALYSLFNHTETLEDFGGFFGATERILPRMTSADDFLQSFYNVHTLNVGARFTEYLRHPGGVMHLSLRLEWETMLSDLRRISNIFRHQVHTLRLERKPIRGVQILDGGDWVEVSDSPMIVCMHLDMPGLRYLEVRDSAYTAEPKEKGEESPLPPPPPPPPYPNAVVLGSPDWMTRSDYEGLEDLDRLAWRPMWAGVGAQFRACADAFVRVAGDALPVLATWVSLQQSERGIWDTWTRLDTDLPLERQCVWDAIKEDAWKRMA